MKYTTTILALAVAVAAQGISDLPSCSLSCVLQGVQSTGCGATDFACSCQKADVLTPIVTPCVQKACPDAADQAKVISTLEGICAAAGFPINVPEPASSSAAPTVETSAPTASPTDIVISDPSSALPTHSIALTEESCVIVTVTETVTLPKTSPAPYPTVPGTGSPVYPTGTGVYTSSPPLFTGAAAAVKVPAGIAGLVGLAAYFL